LRERQWDRATELAQAADGIERNLSSPSASAKVASTADDPGFFFQDFCNWQRIQEYRDLIFQSEAASVAAQLMDASVVRLYHDHLFITITCWSRNPVPGSARRGIRISPSTIFRGE
jgi:hypothetical protein